METQGVQSRNLRLQMLRKKDLHNIDTQQYITYQVILINYNE